MVKRLLALCLSLAIVLGWPGTAYAIALPTLHVIYSAEAYRNVLELNDQLYLTVYNITQVSTDDISKTYLSRVMNGTTELRAVTPYPYKDLGYNYGVIAVYFSAAEVSALSMGWNTGYTVKLDGNPALAWVGGVPPTVTATPAYYDDGSVSLMRTRLTARIRGLAVLTQAAWGWTITDPLIASSALGANTTLTAKGELYFTGVISALRSMCPDVFQAITTTPSGFSSKTYTGTYETGLAGRLIGTPFDFTNLGALVGLSRMWASTIAWLLLSLGLVYLVTRKINDTRPAVLLFFILLPIGALCGFIWLNVALMVGFLFTIAVVYLLLYRYAA